ncbi:MULTISPECIES: hypothetical protein [unclassified Bacillus cereus group]|uniref:hypothetical protein n=1 Tax=unclassified Bacillus cereus group TaxID=2750818 RepID=UPI001F5995D1|nr:MULTISPECIES: hypothetical protein [unclassified Bacillus cereus group]MDA1677141.1 hypothetical protein [Bacillus cereus group sp. TH152-1LC]
MKWKKEDVIFETIREAEVWADGVANEMYGRVFDGYETLDYKVAYALAFLLAQNREFNIHPALMGSKTPTSKFSESKEVRWGINCP